MRSPTHPSTRASPPCSDPASSARTPASGWPAQLLFLGPSASPALGSVQGQLSGGRRLCLRHGFLTALQLPGVLGGDRRKACTPPPRERQVQTQKDCSSGLHEVRQVARTGRLTFPRAPQSHGNGRGRAGRAGPGLVFLVCRVDSSRSRGQASYPLPWRKGLSPAPFQVRTQPRVRYVRNPVTERLLGPSALPDPPPSTRPMHPPSPGPPIRHRLRDGGVGVGAVADWRPKRYVQGPAPHTCASALP